MTPKSTVGISMLTSGVLIATSQLLNKKLPTYRQLVGVFIVYVFLGVGVEITPELAAMFSILVVVVIFFETFEKISPKLESFFNSKTTVPYTESEMDAIEAGKGH
jgi:preprotein translocase subunit Sec61beta